MLSSSGTAKHGFLKLWEMHLEQVSLISTPIKTGAPFRVADQLELRRFQLESVTERFRLQLAGIEQELVSRNTEKGLGQLPHAGLQKILQILAGQYQQGVFLPARPPASRPTSGRTLTAAGAAGFWSPRGSHHRWAYRVRPAANVGTSVRCRAACPAPAPASQVGTDFCPAHFRRQGPGGDALPYLRRLVVPP